MRAPSFELALLRQEMTSTHYSTLGLDRKATLSQIRAAFRILAAEHHPDRHAGSEEAVRQMQELNAAYETLSDPYRRRLYDRDLDAEARQSRTRTGKAERNISQDAHLPLEAFFRGTSLSVRVNDPAIPGGAETYELEIPPNTAPGTRFRLPREGPFAGGVVNLRVKALPGYRFKLRGSDLKCDLRISPQRASNGGSEMLPAPSGQMVHVQIPAGIGRGEILRVPGEGMPKARGGRGDLLVRITYRAPVRVSPRRG
jgi:curved DNA-binding protein